MVILCTLAPHPMEAAMSDQERDVDVSRRDLGALLGILGGAVGVAALTGCSAEANPNSAEQIGRVSQKWTAADGGVTGINFLWVDTIKGVGSVSPGTTLYTMAAGSDATGASSPVVVVGGYWMPGDGGGGIFYWSNASIIDDGGTQIVPVPTGGDGGVGATGPGWVRIYSGALNVKWFGALGDGVDHKGDGSYDTAFLQAAINAAANLEFELGNGGDAGDPENAAYAAMGLDFGFGHYKINAALTIQPSTVGSNNNALNLFSDSHAVIDQLTSTANIIQFGSTTNSVFNKIRGLTFVNGATHIALQSPGNTAPCEVRIENCEFHTAGHYAVSLVPNQYASLASQLVIDHCAFYGCSAAVTAQADYMLIQDCWVQTGTSPVMAGGQPAAVFCNQEVGGQMVMRGMVGVPGYSNSQYSSARWIDNYGSVSVIQSRFGGEVGGGMPVVYHYQPLPANLNATPQDNVILRDCVVGCGTSGVATTSVVYIKNDVSGYTTSCPVQIVLDGLMGPVGPPIIAAASSANLAALLVGNFGNPNVPPTANSGVLSQMRVAIDPNLMRSLGGSGALAIDASLLPFVDVRASGPFPLGHGVAVPVGSSAPSQSYCTFDIPNPSPSGVSAFTALVTISVNPNSGGSGGYRTTAVYYVSMTTGYNGVLCNTMSWGSAFLPSTPGFSTGPTITYVGFGTALSGNQSRAAA